MTQFRHSRPHTSSPNWRHRLEIGALVATIAVPIVMAIGYFIS